MGPLGKKYHESEQSGSNLAACELFMQQVCSGEVMLLGTVSWEGKVREKEEPTALLRELLMKELVTQEGYFN